MWSDLFPTRSNFLHPSVLPFSRSVATANDKTALIATSTKNMMLEGMEEHRQWLRRMIKWNSAFVNVFLTIDEQIQARNKIPWTHFEKHEEKKAPLCSANKSLGRSASFWAANNNKSISWTEAISSSTLSFWASSAQNTSIIVINYSSGWQSVLMRPLQTSLP